MYISNIYRTSDRRDSIEHRSNMYRTSTEPPSDDTSNAYRTSIEPPSDEHRSIIDRTSSGNLSTIYRRSSEIYIELRPTNIYRTSIGHLSNISNLLAPKINRTPIEPPSEDNRSKIYKRSSEHLSKIDRPSFRR